MSRENTTSSRTNSQKKPLDLLLLLQPSRCSHSESLFVLGTIANANGLLVGAEIRILGVGMEDTFFCEFFLSFLIQNAGGFASCNNGQRNASYTGRRRITRVTLLYGSSGPLDSIYESVIHIIFS